MLTHSLGFPRIGPDRELKRTCERYWSGKASREDLERTARDMRAYTRQVHADRGIDIVPSNDFSFYDQVLDTCTMVGAIPSRFQPLMEQEEKDNLDIYFAMARGYQQEGFDLLPMEMTKWFDTNYHYIVPEFTRDQEFQWISDKVVQEFREAKEAGVSSKPTLIGPVSFLLLGKEMEEGFDRVDLLERLLPIYEKIVQKLVQEGAEWIQMEEPFLAMDLSDKRLNAFERAYGWLQDAAGSSKILLATYFDGLRDNADRCFELAVDAVHLDLVRAPQQLHEAFARIPEDMMLSLGLIDGRNVWKNDIRASLNTVSKAIEKLGKERIMLAPSCSLLHCPYDLEAEKGSEALPQAVLEWMAFSVQKLEELALLKDLASSEEGMKERSEAFSANIEAQEGRKHSERIHNERVQDRVQRIDDKMAQRKSAFPERKKAQQAAYPLPFFPTTTIGSLPQTKELRKRRSAYRKGDLSEADYNAGIRSDIENAIRWQEDIGLDVLVHGEFERNDMVEYFGEKLEGFAFTQYGWVQSYGTRCVKPPIIYGDVERPEPMTLEFSRFADSLTDKAVKGMLTGPVTIFQWSFPRNDIPWHQTTQQIALAVRDEVEDLEEAGLSDIQIDEPALREGLPLRRADRKNYLDRAVQAFRIASCPVKDSTRIHTHMCYSEFNDIIEHIAALDADVITIECARSQMELLEAFVDFEYPNDIGPGVYDIHSPRIPSAEDVASLLQKAASVLPTERIWANPDCGLKTREWKDVKEALPRMIEGAQKVREEVQNPVEDA